MSAAPIETLLAYENAIESAVIAFLKRRGIPAVAEFSDATKATPFCDVQLTDIVPTTHRHFYVPPGGGDPVPIVDAWTGTITNRICTERGKNSDKQAPLLGAIRAAAVDASLRNVFPRGILPWHYIELIKETGLIRAVDRENDLDVSELRFSVTFGIRSDSWP